MVGPARRRNHTTLFKGAIVGATVVVIGCLLYFLPAGRYGVARLNSAIERTTGALRDPADPATLDRLRTSAIAAAKAAVEAQWSVAAPSKREFLREAGLSPEEAVCRWGNGENAAILSGKVFEADEHRSYRFRPNARAVWLRLEPQFGPPESYLVPDDPRIRSLGKELGYVVLEGTEQSTNSWGCRGPEPDLSAELRILVIGDSFMQGMFVGDAETPPRRLEERLRERSGKTVSVLNTGHLGYSPEEYYYTALEYIPRFRPRLVVISVCANDTRRQPGSAEDLLSASDWLGKIRDLGHHKVAPPAISLMVLAPLHNNLEATRNTMNYPTVFLDMAKFRASHTLDPTEAFINEDLRLRGPDAQGPLPLFNIPLKDGHFSARGCAVWAEETARRILRLLGIGRESPPSPEGPRS